MLSNRGSVSWCRFPAWITSYFMTLIPQSFCIPTPSSLMIDFFLGLFFLALLGHHFTCNKLLKASNLNFLLIVIVMQNIFQSNEYPPIANHSNLPSLPSAESLTCIFSLQIPIHQELWETISRDCFESLEETQVWPEYVQRSVIKMNAIGKW